MKKHILDTLKALIPDAICVGIFVIISLVYFAGPISEHKVLTGHDHTGGVGAGHELELYREAHGGERTRWTNTLFSGMPTYQMTPSYDSTDTLATIKRVFMLGISGEAGYVFLLLLGFYIMLRCFDFRAWMAALGAVLWAFSSYYFIIIAAGHIWKVLTLAFIPPTIGGMALCYRGKYGLGIIVAALFMGLQILSNHVQMTYYFLFPMVLMSIGCLVDALRMNRGQVRSAFAKWLKGSVCFALGCLLGVALNISNLYHTWEYQKESMRGKTELTNVSKNEADQTSSGLERSYITMWSYGLGETWSLLIPNVKGGASVPLTQSQKAMEKAENQFRPVYQQLGQYWGEQPMTSGPVYVGAFVMMLFVLGLLVVRGAKCWALLLATMLSVVLSWGKNFMWFTDLFLDYVPMYDKFRTVSSILVIAEFTIPLLAIMAIKSWMDMVNDENKALVDKATKRMWIAFGVTAGVCALFWIMPDLFFGEYISTQEKDALSRLSEYGWPVDRLFANLNDMRRSVFQADCLRSLTVIIVGTALLLAYRYKKLGENATLWLVTILCLVDMWAVNKRYLNDGMFQRERPVQALFEKNDADEWILQDEALYSRTLDLTESTFNSNTASYWHKSIGGYHPAKLRRYQEVIERYLHSEIGKLQGLIIQNQGQLGGVRVDSIAPVLCMLNSKFVLMPAGEGAKVPVMNPYCNGNAWFVNKISYVKNADEELAALGQIDNKNEAVADEKFRDVLGEKGGMGNAMLTGYEANELKYSVQTPTGGVLVMSDIYYPGWTATLDGKDIPVGRVNYILRAVVVPAGEHVLVMKFDPKTVHTTEAIAYGSYVILLLILVIVGIAEWRRRRS